jgi:NTE family protein
MATRPTKRTHRTAARPPFDCIALLLQGGGALGAYQAGVYEALDEAGIAPNWIAGISIGAVNAAIVAGNRPEDRVAKLREFWEAVTSDHGWVWALAPEAARHFGDFARGVANQASAAVAMAQGAPGFFAPRAVPPWLCPSGTAEAISFYDTAALKSTLEQVADFDRINSGELRMSVGAVNVRTGNFSYFDSTTHVIRPEHVMASGAMPPGLPPVEIEGQHYWDGGLVSNTPLHWVVEHGADRDLLVFQVDLWSARGEAPRDMPEVLTRQKEIQYSSRTRAATSQFKSAKTMRHAIAALLGKLPKTQRDSPEARYLAGLADDGVCNIVHLIYRTRAYEGHSKDYEFSRLSMEEHWRAGYQDTVRTLRHPEVLERPTCAEGVVTFDLSQDGRE